MVITLQPKQRIEVTLRAAALTQPIASLTNPDNTYVMRLAIKQLKDQTKALEQLACDLENGRA